MMRTYPRRCTVCAIPKAAEDFYVDKQGRGDGRFGACKPCHNARAEARRRANPERDRQRSRVYHAAHRETIDARTRARLRREQAASLGGARNARKVWTSAELEFVAAGAARTARELAATLGRSTYAVKTMRQKIARDPRKARLADIDSPLADLAAPETINIAPRYEG